MSLRSENHKWRLKGPKFTYVRQPCSTGGAWEQEEEEAWSARRARERDSITRAWRINRLTFGTRGGLGKWEGTFPSSWCEWSSLVLTLRETIPLNLRHVRIVCPSWTRALVHLWPIGFPRKKPLTQTEHRLRSEAVLALPSRPVQQGTEATLRSKIYFASVSFGRLTLMWICGGMLGAGAWSRENTAGTSALWENTPRSHISSNRHFVVLTRVRWGVRGKLFFCCCSSYFWCRHTDNFKVSQKALRHHGPLWWGWWGHGCRTLTQNTFKQRSVLR